MQNEWNLHLLRVVIEDGEPERQEKDEFTWFAVSFWTDDVLLQSPNHKRSAVPLENYSYCVNAEVVYISKDPAYPSCVIDFGIKAISESGSILGIPLPTDCEIGDFVSGTISLELPLCTDIHPCKLNHKWQIKRVVADLANFSVHPGDRGNVEYVNVAGTDTIKAGSYILLCSDQDME